MITKRLNGYNQIPTIADRMNKTGLTQMLSTRIRVDLGLTMPTSVRFQMIKPGVSIEFTVPDGMSADEAYKQATEYLAGKLEQIANDLQEMAS